MNSFISWVGGKKLLRKKIVQEFPEYYKRYVEVFGGAAWVLFGLEHTGKIEIYNDKNSNLVNLFRCMKYHCDELQRELDLILNSREQFYCFKQQLKCEGLTDIQRAARFYILIRNSYGSKTENFVAGKYIKTTLFSEIAQRLSKVTIENKDYKNIIISYDKPDTLFYLDPPYYGSEHMYDECFTNMDHEEMRDILVSIKGKFILSYNDNPCIRELYNGFNIVEVERQNNLSCKTDNQIYKELIIKNF